MLVTPLPIVTLVKPVQPENAKPPILVTLLGIVILVKPLQPENTAPPMLVTLFGIVRAPVLPSGHISREVLSLLYKTPSKLLYFVLLESTVIAVKLLKP